MKALDIIYIMIQEIFLILKKLLYSGDDLLWLIGKKVMDY